MTSFVDYSYYKESYGGTSVPSASFNYLSLKASYFINNITQGRAKNNTTYIEEIKLATCSVIDKMHKVESDGGIKISETVGKHSVTYATPSDLEENKSYYKAAAIFLADTGLLYRGVDKVAY